jgi:hypothetical protein
VVNVLYKNKNGENDMKFDRFILFPWGMISRTGERAEKLLEGIKDCGFNASCFVPKSEFETCRRLGLEIYCSLDKYGSEERSLSHEKILLNPDSTQEELREVMHNLLQDLPEDVRAVYLTDEPGASLFPKLRTLVECVHEDAPWAEAYINLFPNYAVCGAANLSQLEADNYEEYLNRFATEVHPDAISFDNYRVIISDNFKKDGGRENFYQNLIQVRKFCDQHDLPMQFIGCCNQLRNWLTIPTFYNLALQGHAALAAGARVISWFLYYSRNYYLFAPVDDTSGKDIRTSTWYILREVNRRILALGNLLFDMEHKGMYFTKPEGLTDAKSISECSVIKNFSSDEECVVGHYVDSNGQDVLLVVNGSLQKATTVELDMGGELEVYNLEQHTWMKPLLTARDDIKSPVWLEPGCGIAIRVASMTTADE